MKRIKAYFKNKSVVLTGGSSGIGLATARMLRKCDAHLLIIARDEEKLDKTKKELATTTDSRAEIHTLSLDVSDRSKVQNTPAKIGWARTSPCLLPKSRPMGMTA